MRLLYLVLEDVSLKFADAAQYPELIEEIQLLLRDAGCRIEQVDGCWSANVAASMGVFCAIHEITADGITPALAHELLKYRQKFNG